MGELLTLFMSIGLSEEIAKETTANVELSTLLKSCIDSVTISIVQTS